MTQPLPIIIGAFFFCGAMFFTIHIAEQFVRLLTGSFGRDEPVDPEHEDFADTIRRIDERLSELNRTCVEIDRKTRDPENPKPRVFEENYQIGCAGEDIIIGQALARNENGALVPWTFQTFNVGTSKKQFRQGEPIYKLDLF